MPVALNEAIANPPCTSSRRSAEAAVTSAVSGPTRTRTRLPTRETEAISPRTRFRAESVRVDAADRDVPGIDDHADVALRGVGRVDGLAALQAHASEPAVDKLDVAAQQVGSGEGGHERVARLRDELRRRAELAQLALDKHAHGSGERCGVLVVVRDDQRRQVERLQQLLQLEPDRVLRMRVERSQRLVEQQHTRVARERPRQRHPLPLAAGELARPRVGEVRDAEALEQLGDALLAAEGDVALDAQVREERVLLEDEPDAPVLGRAAGRRIEPDLVIDRDPAGRPRQPGDRPQHGALPGAGGPDERDRALDVERELQVERAERKLEVCREGCHVSTSLRTIRSAALTTTSSAPTASAVSKSTENSW